MQELIELEDWEDKYEFLIDLGIALPKFDPKYKTLQNQVFGCQSRVWLFLEIFDGNLHILGDSDALFTKGLLALVIAEYHKKPLLEINFKILEKYNLSKNLSIGRQNGLEAILSKIQKFVETNKNKK